MKTLFLFAVILTSLTSLAAKDCDESMSLSKPVKAKTGRPYSYEVSISKHSFEVGGTAEEFLGSVDKEAVKRVLVSCSPGVLRCLTISGKSKLSGEFLISFKLNTDKSNSRISHFKVTSSTFNGDPLTNCLKDLWSSQLYPALGAGVDVIEASVPVKITASK